MSFKKNLKLGVQIQISSSPHTLCFICIAEKKNYVKKEEIPEIINCTQLNVLRRCLSL